MRRAHPTMSTVLARETKADAGDLSGGGPLLFPCLASLPGIARPCDLAIVIAHRRIMGTAVREPPFLFFPITVTGGMGGRFRPPVAW